MFIDNLRQKSQSKVLKVVMGVIALSFALFGVQNFLIASGKDVIVAKVGDMDISESLLAHETENNINRWVQQNHQKRNQTLADQMRQMTLSQLVQKFSQIQAADKMGFYADNVLVSDMIVNDPTFARDGQFDKEQYRLILRRLGMSEGQLFATMSDDLLLNQLQASVLTSAFVLPVEEDHFASIENETRDLAVLTLSPSLVKKVKVGDKAIADYYHDHSMDFMTEDKVKLSYLQIDRKQQGSEEAFLSLSDQLADLSYGEANALDDTAKQLGLKLHHSGWLTKSGVSQGLFAEKGLIEAAFSAAVLHEGENSGVIPVGGSKAVVLRVSQHQDATLKPLGNVKAGIAKKLRSKAQRDALLVRAHAMVDDINALADKHALQRFASNYGLSIKFVKHVGRKPSQTVPVTLQQLAFQHLRPHNGHLTSAVLADDDVQVVVLLDRHEGKVADTLKSHFLGLQRQSELLSLQQGVLADTKISV